MFGFINDIAKAVTGAISNVTKALGIDKLTDLVGGAGRLSGLLASLAKLSSLSTPTGVFGILNDVFGALGNNKDKASQGATSSAANSILGQIPTAKKFGL